MYDKTSRVSHKSTVNWTYWRSIFSETLLYKLKYKFYVILWNLFIKQILYTRSRVQKNIILKVYTI